MFFWIESQCCWCEIFDFYPTPPSQALQTSPVISLSVESEADCLDRGVSSYEVSEIGW